jgi:hypothetical protein
LLPSHNVGRFYHIAITATKKQDLR